MSSLKEQKEALRKRVLSTRGDMPQEEWEAKSEEILQKLTSADFFDDAHVVHTYISMNERREVNTDHLLEKLFDSERKVVVPVTNFTDHTLHHVALSSFGELITNKWGVREPDIQEQKLVDEEELDLIIVPMAAADRQGNRLGYGQGFYDRFLEQTKALKVGLTFSEFLFDGIPVEEFDVKLDVIITEEEFIFS